MKTPTKNITIYTDGSLSPALPQNGFACAAFLVFDGDILGSYHIDSPYYLRHKPLHIKHFFIGRSFDGFTSNIAEWKGFIGALLWIKKHGQSDWDITINVDSQLVERQFTGIYAVKAEHLMTLHQQAKDIVREIKPIINLLQVKWIKRELNKAADDLTKIANKEAREKYGYS